MSSALRLAAQRVRIRSVGWAPTQTDAPGDLPNPEILMARLASVIIHKGFASGTTPIESDPSQNDLFGRADEMAIQVNAQGAPANTTLTLKYWSSNEGGVFVTRVTLLNAVLIDTSPYDIVIDLDSIVNGNKGKFEFFLGGAGAPSANLTITACLRTR